MTDGKSVVSGAGAGLLGGLLFSAGFAYTWAAPRLNEAQHAYVAALFVAALALLFAFLAPRLLDGGLKERSVVRLLLILTAALHLGILTAAQLSGHGPELLWVADSYQSHLPGSVAVANRLAGKDALAVPGGGGKVSDETYMYAPFFTHLWGGLFFYLFGLNVFVSGAALLIVKLATVFLIYRLAKAMFDDRVAAVAALIYVLMPTILFYTTTFCKEAVIEFLTAAIAAALFALFQGGPSLPRALALLCALAALLNERFYLFLTFVPAGALLLILQRRKLKGLSLASILGVLAAASAFLVRKFVRVHFFDPHHSGAVWVLTTFLHNSRSHYLDRPDVSAINRQLPYALAFLKLCFTPYFNLGKFGVYDKFSYMLIWASPLNQLVIAASIGGMILAVRSDWRRHWFAILPYLLFLLLFAYIAPYQARLRDSYYPVIAIYAASLLVRWRRSPASETGA